MKIYLIPGLGADGRMYESLMDLLPDAEVLDWFVPMPDEEFKDYIDRFSKQIKTKEPFAIIGNSMGGIIAVELAKRLKPDKIIIISSVKCRKELPHFIRLGKYISLFRSTTGKFYNVINRAIVKLLQLRSEKKFLQLALDMSKDADPEFMSWAIKKVMQWENKTYPHDIVHIHGTRDTLFPILYIKNCIRVKGGTHLMMMERSDEINSLILAALQK
ncbi:MAG: alpha/beta hydrolase [Bacteroidota bacterium]